VELIYTPAWIPWAKQDGGPGAMRRLIAMLGNSTNVTRVSNQASSFRAAAEDGLAIAAKREHTLTSRPRYSTPFRPIVVVLWPLLEAMCLAHGITPKGRTMIALQWGDSDHVVPGRANACGAENLRTDDPSPTPDPELEKGLDRISFQGNNGWTRGYGTDHATRELSPLEQRADFDLPTLQGAMILRGHSAEAITRLKALATKA
jgi:hypothetical protein